MAAFEFDQTVSVSGPPEVAWNLITDVPRLVSWISVVNDANEVKPLEEYTAVIQDKVGMFTLRADLNIRLTEVEEGKRVVALAEGQDRQIGSRISIRAEVLLDADPESTQVRVKGSYEITGSGATLGSSAIRRKGEKVIQEFFKNLGDDLLASQ